MRSTGIFVQAILIGIFWAMIAFMALIFPIRSDNRVDITWTWKNKLLNANNQTVRIEELDGDVILRHDESFSREGWLSTPNDGLDPGEYRIRDSVEIKLKSGGSTQRYSVTETSGIFVVE